MRVVSISVGASHKLAVPGRFETVNPSLTLTAEVGEGEDLTAAIDQLKATLEEQYWRLAWQDFWTAVQRANIGTGQWLTARFQSPSKG